MELFVRVNPLESGDAVWLQDVQAVVAAGCGGDGECAVAGLMLPKVNSAADVQVYSD